MSFLQYTQINIMHRNKVITIYSYIAMSNLNTGRKNKQLELKGLPKRKPVAVERLSSAAGPKAHKYKY